MKQCPNCGRYSEDDALSCANCGTVYPQGAEAPAGNGSQAPFEGYTPDGGNPSEQWNSQQGGYQQPWNGQQGGYQQPWNGQQGGYQQPWNGQQGGYQQPWNGQQGGYQQPWNGQQGGYQQPWNGQQGGYQNQGWGGDPYRGYQPPFPGAGQPPIAKTKKEFLKLPENRKMRTELTSCAVLCYITAGISLLVGLLVLKNPAVLLDVALVLGLGLGVHLAQSRTCAVLLLAYSLINCILSIVVSGKPGGYFVIIAGIFAVIYTFRLEKAWQQYRQQTMQIQPPQGPEV